MDESYQTQHDFAKRCPVHAVVITIAAIENTAVTDLEPLASVVDPDGLNAFVSPTGDRPVDGSVTFTYCGHRVLVRSDGEVVVDTDPG